MYGIVINNFIVNFLFTLFITVLTPADAENHIDKRKFTSPFVCGCRNLGEALRRISEGAAMIRTKGEAGTGTEYHVIFFSTIALPYQHTIISGATGTPILDFGHTWFFHGLQPSSGQPPVSAVTPTRVTQLQ